MCAQQDQNSPLQLPVCNGKISVAASAQDIFFGEQAYAARVWLMFVIFCSLGLEELFRQGL